MEPLVPRRQPAASRHARVCSIDREAAFGAQLVPVCFSNLAIIRHFTPPILSRNSQHVGRQPTKAQVISVGESHDCDGQPSKCVVSDSVKSIGYVLPLSYTKNPSLNPPPERVTQCAGAGGGYGSKFSRFPAQNCGGLKPVDKSD